MIAIMDWATRKVLAWRLANTLDTRFCVEALKEALFKYGAPEIFNTDQHGWQRTIQGQHLYRATLVYSEIRKDLPEVI
jgi:hypothetical protein